MPEPEPVRASIRSTGRVASSSRLETRVDTRSHSQLGGRDDRRDDYVESPIRGQPIRATTFQGPTSISREPTPSNYRQNTVPAEVGSLRANLRPSNRVDIRSSDVFGDPSDRDDSTLNSGSPDRSYGARSVSPATSHGTAASGRKGPPPPPPSRAKKPPPPPPMKRSEISSASIHR